LWAYCEKKATKLRIIIGLYPQRSILNYVPPFLFLFLLWPRGCYSCINQLYTILNVVALFCQRISKNNNTAERFNRTCLLLLLLAKLKQQLNGQKPNPVDASNLEPGSSSNSSDVDVDASVSVRLCMANELQLKFN